MCVTLLACIGMFPVRITVRTAVIATKVLFCGFPRFLITDHLFCPDCLFHKVFIVNCLFIFVELFAVTFVLIALQIKS